MPWLSCCRVATLADVLSLVQKANSGGKDVGVFVQVRRLLARSCLMQRGDPGTVTLVQASAASHAGALHLISFFARMPSLHSCQEL